MFRDADPRSFAAIYLVCGRTDMRYGIDSLAAIVEAKCRLSLFVPGTLFLFCGRRANKIKGLVWEGDGSPLFTKRVEEGRFSWPRNSAEAKLLTPKQFEWLMDGFPIDPEIKIACPHRDLSRAFQLVSSMGILATPKIPRSGAFSGFVL